MINAITQFCLLDVVALKETLPQHQLQAGQVGTIVELLAPDVYEIEFSDDEGQTYAMLPLHASQLLKLHYHSYSEEASFNIANTINQYGLGDNIAGDKVGGDKVMGDKITHYHSQNLVQAAQEIKALLDQLDRDYDRSTPTGQAMISAKAIEKIEQNPTLKARVVNALKEGGAAALEAAVDHPAVKPVVALLKGFMDA